MDSNIITGRNSVMEALKTDRQIDKLIVLDGERKGSILEIVALAKDKGITIEFTNIKIIKNIVGDLNHQGVVAFAAPIKYYEIEEVLKLAKEKNEVPFLVLLDELQDPHNVGAIIRTAAAVGAHGVLLPKRKGAGITPTVLKTAVGALEYVPIVRIGNITQTLNALKSEGFWVVGADMDGEKEYFEERFNYPVVIVIGSEGKGISRLVKETCDITLNIPIKNGVSSLNASVAAGILLYEVYRQRL